MTRRGTAVAAGVALVLVGCSGSAPAADPATLARGEAIYQQSCIRCHGGATGGEISDIPPVHNANGHTWHHPDCLLEEIIRDGLPPRSNPDAPVMPGFADELTDDDIDAVLAHIRTWWTPQQREQQAATTAEACT